jgi:hypothetical protein
MMFAEFPIFLVGSIPITPPSTIKLGIAHATVAGCTTAGGAAGAGAGLSPADQSVDGCVSGIIGLSKIRNFGILIFWI